MTLRYYSYSHIGVSSCAWLVNDAEAEHVMLHNACRDKSGQHPFCGTLHLSHYDISCLFRHRAR